MPTTKNKSRKKSVAAAVAAQTKPFTAAVIAKRARSGRRAKVAVAPRIVKRAVRLLEVVVETADERIPNWIDLHNVIFGPGGMVIKNFPTQADRIAFVATKEYRAIFDLIEDLREEQGDPEPQPLEELTNPAGKILLRVPRSLHAALIAEAESEGVSVNQLILAKLAAQLRAVV